MGVDSAGDDGRPSETTDGEDRRTRRGKRLSAAKTHPTIQAKQNLNQLRVARFAHDFDADAEESVAQFCLDEMPKRRSELFDGFCRVAKKVQRRLSGTEMYLITTLSPAPAEVPLINRLPQELLLKCFSYLDVRSLCRCAQTCRVWNQLALDGSNWQDVDLFTFQRDIKAHVVENLARRCGGFLKQLSLKGCENIQDSALRSFTAKCANIEHLSLFKCKRVTDATCENLGRHCHKLRYLNLENCTTITDRALKFIGEGCKQLEYLNISWCDNVQDRGVHVLLAGCPRLETLIMRGCEGLTERMFTGMEKHMASLVRLNLLNCFVNDETLSHIAAGAPNLEYLCLSQCNQVTDRSLASLSNGCKQLQVLELTGCQLVSDGGMQQLARGCRQLQRLDLEDCSLITDASIHALASQCRNISDLVLSHCELLTDDSIQYIAANLRDMIKVVELDNCPLITDSGLMQLRPCHALQRIELYDCQGVSKDAIARFKHHRPGVDIHAYFAPATPPQTQHPQRAGRCCVIL